MIIMFLEMKEFAFHLYAESRDRSGVGGWLEEDSLWSIFSKPKSQGLELKILELEPLFKNSGSWEPRARGTYLKIIQSKPELKGLELKILEPVGSNLSLRICGDDLGSQIVVSKF